jgi:hypothetical protein
MQSIELCVARFDDDTKESFLDLYTKIDAGIITGEEDGSGRGEDALTEETEDAF